MRKHTAFKAEGTDDWTDDWKVDSGPSLKQDMKKASHVGLLVLPTLQVPPRWPILLVGSTPVSSSQFADSPTP